jgi:hypothetical protein
MRRTALGLAFVSMLLVCTPAASQLEKDDWTLTKTPPREWRMPDRIGRGGILALAFVDPTRQRVVVAREDDAVGDTPVYRYVSFYQSRDGKLIETHQFKTSYLFSGMRGNILGTRLITTWASGSAYRTGVFVMEKDDVRLVLWFGWKSPPEFVDLDGDGEDEVIQPVYRLYRPGSFAPSEAIIWRWNGNGYSVVRRAPWAERYRLR